MTSRGAVPHDQPGSTTLSDAAQIRVTLEQEDDYAFRIRFDDTALQP